MEREKAPLLELTGLVCGRGGKKLVGDLDLALAAGEILFLLGPNGAGKTTLLKTVLRQLPPLAGTMRIFGEDIVNWPAWRFARKVAYVPQSHRPPFPFTVFDVALTGRAAHHGAFVAPSARDRALADEALATVGVSSLRDRRVTEISGGERQLVLLARALAQQPALLVMDEPTANLDFGNQISVLDHARALAKQIGLGVVIATHDPNQALAYGAKVALLGRDGRVALGAPCEMVTAAWLEKTYGVRTRIVAAPSESEPMFCLPLPGARTSTFNCERSQCAY